MANASSTLPIDKLTDDILRQIFMWAVYGITTDNPMAGGRRFRFGSIAPGRSGMLYVLHPIIIGHVCSHWRNLTFSSPVLWSTMVVEPRRSRDVEIFAFWLERSGGASLSLTFFFPDDYEPPMAEAFRLAFQHRSRWREISLISRFEWFDENMITGTLASEWQQATFDQLESFSVLGAFVSSVHQLSWNPLPPVFRSPTLKALGVPFDCLWQGAPLPQLTSLSLSGSTSASPASVLAILSRCALLKELRVGIDDIVDAIPSDYRELVLANLISLDINGSGTGPCTVLTHITTPQLVILKLSQYSLPEPPTLPFEALFKFAQRSNCRLQSLTLDGAKDATVEPPTLRLLLLPSISSLDELSFEDSPNLASAVVNALTSTPTLLPGLRVINFDRSSHFLHNVEAPELLSALLQSRTMLRAEVGRR